MYLSKYLKNNSVSNLYIKIIISIIWFTLLMRTSSYLSVYFYIILLYLFFVFINKDISVKSREIKISICFACIFSLLVTISNYDIYNDSYYHITKILGLFMIFISSIFIFFYILISIYNLINTRKFNVLNNTKNSKVFISSFLILLVIYLFFYFTIAFPGYISEDGIAQISQIETGLYNNHHPVGHTYLIKIFYDLGILISNNKIIAVSCYIIFQIIIYALVVSFANSTLSEIGTNKVINIIFCLYFGIMPFNIIYSFTLFKDVIFSIFFLLMFTCYIRINYKIGNKIINTILLIISFVGIGLFRTNGKFVLIPLLLFLILMFKKERIMILSLLVGLIVVFSLDYYSSNVKNIESVDTVESLSIPIQQISRVICDENDLTNDELDLLNNIIEVDSISTNYDPGLSDPIKKMIREKGNQKYFTEHIFDYMSLYLKLGLRHPIKYIDAWVDQTKGYINGGYDGSIYYMMIADNNYGIYSTNCFKPIYELFRCYNALFSKNTLQIIVSSGVQTWLIILCLYIGVIFRNKKVILLSLPSLLLVATLLIATPVCAEFRYAYSLYMTNFFVIVNTIHFVKNGN